MPDDIPISTTVSETPVMTDPGIDKETVQNLNAAFDDFWAETDSKDDLSKEPRTEAKQPEAKQPPPAPEVGAGQETRTEATEQPDIDKMELPPHTRPEHVEQFKKIKDLWKADQRRAEETSKRAQALEQELAEARKNAWTPETRADYEHAASIRRRFDFMSDPDFLQRFQTPVQTQFDKALSEAVKVLPNRQAAAEWANKIKADGYGPDSVNRDWWMNDVVAKVPDELGRTALINQVSKLLDLQSERDSEIHRRTNDRSQFDNWMVEKNQTTQTRVNEEIMTEIREQEKRIQEVFPVDVTKAKTADERAAMEAHNERFEGLNKFFIKTLQDCTKNGPRGWVRTAIEATRTQIMDKQIVNLEKENKELKTERDRLQKDLEKVTGARRRIAHSSGAPSTSSAQSKQNGMSIKDLSDPRKAMESFFNEVDRNQ
jgi:hypothetical protein